MIDSNFKNRITAHWSWVVDSKYSGLRLDQALTQALKLELGFWKPPTIVNEIKNLSITRTRIQSYIHEGQVTLNQKQTKANALVHTHDLIEMVTLLEPMEDISAVDLIPEERELETLFEDEHLLVLNKPQGLTVHPSTTQKTGTLVHALLAKKQTSLSRMGGKLRPGIVHRLDKNTSGALVVSKTDLAHEKLSQIFSKHAIEREYWAFVYGSPKFNQTPYRYETLIGRNPNDRKRMSIHVKKGRSAISIFQCHERYRLNQDQSSIFASFVTARLETGRTHQIRVHLTSLGCSILGDPLYGTPTSSQVKLKNIPLSVREKVLALPGQALHARTLAFEHPITHQKISCQAEPPFLFKTLHEELRKFL